MLYILSLRVFCVQVGQLAVDISVEENFAEAKANARHAYIRESIPYAVRRATVVRHTTCDARMRESSPRATAPSLTLPFAPFLS